MKDWEWLGWWLGGRGGNEEVVGVLMGPEGIRLCGESQQSAAGWLADLGLLRQETCRSLVFGTTGRVLVVLWALVGSGVDLAVMQ